MRNWGTAVTAFYILIVASLSPPIAYLAALEVERWSWTKLSAATLKDWAEIISVVSFVAWKDLYPGQYFGWVALLAGGPLVLLFIRVDPKHMKLRPRRHIFVSATATGLTLSVLVAEATASVIVAVMGDKPLHEKSSGYGSFLLEILLTWLGAWLPWTLVLWRLGERILEPASRLNRWRMAGSAIELLITVPAHLIVRQRNDCTAPWVSGFGVATGIAVLLMSLGPGALFLYRARMRRLRPHENRM